MRGLQFRARKSGSKIVDVLPRNAAAGPHLSQFANLDSILIKLLNAIFTMFANNLVLDDCARRSLTLHGAVASLVSVGSDFLTIGKTTEALAAFDAAHSIILSPHTSEGWTKASRYLDIACDLIKSEDKSNDCSVASSPDLYEEDECDVGPRMMDTTVVADTNCLQNPALLETIILFNKAIAYQSEENWVEAKQLYELVIYSLQKLTTSTANPSHIVTELSMRTHNNFGVISYLEENTKLASLYFLASIQCADQLAPFSKIYRLQYATALSNFCRVSWMQGDVSDRLYDGVKKVLKIRSRELSWDHPDVAASRYNLAVVEHARKNNEAAIAQLKQYLAAWKNQSAGHNHDDFDPIPAMIYLLLIQNEDKFDNMSLELYCAVHSLQDKRHNFGPDGLEVASLLNYVGTLLFRNHDLESALIFFQEELRLEDANESLFLNFSDSASTISVTCNNIGRIMQELGHFHEAIKFYTRALESRRNDLTKIKTSLKVGTEFQSDSPGIDIESCTSSSANLYSTVWYNLGLIHDKLGAYEEAISAFQMSLDIRKILLGSNHPDNACLLYNIGVLQMEQQRLSDASSSFREALRIRRLGTAGQLNDSRVVKTLETLASLHKAKGNFHSALEALREVVAIQESSKDSDSIFTAKHTGITLRSIAELFHATGDMKSATKTAIESVHKLHNLSTSIHSVEMDPEQLSMAERVANVEQVASSLLLLGSYYHELCEPIQAKQILREGSIVIQQTLAAARNDTSASIPSSLIALQEVVNMVATCQCAPQA